MINTKSTLAVHFFLKKENYKCKNYKIDWKILSANQKKFSVDSGSGNTNLYIKTMTILFALFCYFASW